MKALAAAAALVTLTLGLTAGLESSAHAARPAPWWPTEHSSRFLHGRRLSCTATVSSAVRVGQALTVRFALHNRSRHAVTLQRWFGDGEFTLTSPDGTNFDSTWWMRYLISIPPPLPEKLPAGGTWHLAAGADVRWTGPLTVKPTCFDKRLPALRVRVVAPWPKPDESTSIDEVVAAAGHLLDHCHPQTPGVAVDGQIYPPSGDAPPMDAQCSVSLAWDGPFLQAHVLILIPPGLQGVQAYPPYETLWPSDGWATPPDTSPPYEAIAWEFVVTRYGARPVAASSLDATKPSKHRATAWEWNGKRFVNAGWGSCGFSGASWGGTGPYFDVISTC